MNKGIAIKAGIILGFFIVVLGLAYGCSSVKDKNVTPEISNRDDVYLTVGDITVTRQELWELMRISDGITYLEQFIEENYFLSTELAAVTPEQVAEKIEFYKYGSNDPETIAEIQEDAELEAELLKQYHESLTILGYDPEDLDDQREFVELEIVKEAITREYINTVEETITSDGAEVTQLKYLSETDLEIYYNENYKGDVCALDIRFFTTAEAEEIFNQLELVPNYNLGFGKYFGDEPIDTLSTGDFDETNTIQLNQDQVFAYFLRMYNIMNPNLPHIPDGTVDGVPVENAPVATYEELCQNDEFNYNYSEMTEDRVNGDPYLTFAGYIFNTLGTDEGDIRFSYTLQSIGDFKVLTFKVNQEEIDAYDDIDQALKDEMATAIVDEMLAPTNARRQTYINEAMNKYWEAVEFEIFDPILKLKHVYNGGDEMKNQGHETLVATLDDNEITADMLFAYMDSKIGTYYTIELVKNKALLASDKYTEIYGESQDFLNSNNEKMKQHRDDLRLMKGTFSNDGYANYGFSSSTYTWEEFLVVAFGSATEADVIRDLYVIGSIQPYFIKDMISYENAAGVVQNVIDEYFSLDVEHLLVYVDRDRDFGPDEFNDYVDGLEGQDLIDYNAMRVAIENLIEDRINDEKTFADIVEEFEDGLINDVENEWAVFKAYGFILKTENLSAQNSLSPATTQNYDKDFVVAVKNLYDDYVALVDASATDVTELYDDELIQTNFGLHFLYSKQGDDFEMPTAVYDNSEGTYSEGAGGETVIPTQAQVDLYIDIKFSEQVGEVAGSRLPSSVYDAVEAFYGETYSSYFTTSGYSLVTVSYMLDNNITYATNQADSVGYLEAILEVLYSSTFPEGFTAPE